MKKIFLFIAGALFISNTYGQEIALKPTVEKALIKTSVINESNKPIVGEQVFFTSKTKGQKYKGVTNKEGLFSILVPIGDTYLVEYSNLTKKERHNEITIPSEPAYYTWDVNIKFEPARVIVLENVEYEFNKANIKPVSFNTLNDLFEVMNLKPNLTIEIGGHTDNIGNDKSNQILSLKRAEAIKQYLVKKGINAKRIQTKGYAASVPIDDNSTDSGRQKNRRTEVTVITE